MAVCVVNVLRIESELCPEVHPFVQAVVCQAESCSNWGLAITSHLQQDSQEF
jgi:hypothetical protein